MMVYDLQNICPAKGLDQYLPMGIRSKPPGILLSVRFSTMVVVRDRSYGKDIKFDIQD